MYFDTAERAPARTPLLESIVNPLSLVFSRRELRTSSSFSTSSSAALTVWLDALAALDEATAD